MKQIIFQINGGIGKTIMATAVCRAIKNQYPDSKLIVVSGYSDVFINNPYVNRTYNFGQMSYFYSDNVEGKDVMVLAHDPYMETSFVKQDKHLIQIWCEMFGIKYNGELPEVFLTEREYNFNKNKYQSEKPILVMQTNGGADQQQNKYSFARDIPAKNVVEVIEAFKNDYTIAHLRRDDQPAYEFTTPVQDNFRSIVTLMSLSKKRLLIDSFSQHLAAALKLKSSVCWITNPSKVFGYEMHDNIEANPFTKEPELRNSYLGKFDFTGQDMIQFPYNSETEIFDTDKIIASINAQ